MPEVTRNLVSRLENLVPCRIAACARTAQIRLGQGALPDVTGQIFPLLIRHACSLSAAQHNQSIAPNIS